MCGILFSLLPSTHPSSPLASPLASPLLPLISRRGPDITNTHTTTFASSTLTFTSSVLSLRGHKLTPQPLIDPYTGSVLCWNGEVWKLNSAPVPSGSNDGEEVFKLLLSTERTESVFEGIEGPWACVFFDAAKGRVWFGRDCLGRRSLMVTGMRWGEGHGLVVASVGGGVEGAGWEEVEADGMRVLDLNSGSGGFEHVPFLHEEAYDARMGGALSMRMPFPRLNKTVGLSRSLTVDAPEVQQLLQVLTESIRIRVRDIPEPPGGQGKKPRLAILFSGGLDCSIIARLAHECLPIDEGVDLLNVAFENKRVLEAKMSGIEASKMKRKSKRGLKETNREGQPPIRDDAPVPFEENGTNTNIYEICPDRITGRKSLEELRLVCPGRDWRFVQVNVPYDELSSHRKTVIDLIHPHNTEMDLSIALAFYFASRGLGTVAITSDSSISENVEYATAARILLSGLGADELLGGYARHATAYRFRGYEGLLHELELDIGRLGKRNLGRDDRVLAHWGREARYPFLDEGVVRWCLESGVVGKCGEGEEVMEGKRVLRMLARCLGMGGIAAEKKRAVQFGSRSARMETGAKGKVKGTQILALAAVV